MYDQLILSEITQLIDSTDLIVDDLEEIYSEQSLESIIANLSLIKQYIHFYDSNDISNIIRETQQLVIDFYMQEGNIMEEAFKVSLKRNLLNMRYSFVLVLSEAI